MNRLASSTSPYLLSHAHNPVDWYPWGREALDRAKAEDKAVFVSIGYAACHWCHVMERESFEDAGVAAVLNEHFISIKVDREERPDVDQLYMAATVAMTGAGGWPMTVFITPDGRPFFAGTYFPKTAKYGKPGFLDILARIQSVWADQRADLEAQASALVEAVKEDAAFGRAAAIGPEAEQNAVRSILRGFDTAWGGFGGAPKFPAPFTLSLLLCRAVEHGDANAREAATVTLDRMARGGLYDHVGGGFARYSTDRYWHVPHFEKMLYDNAQLAKVYAEAHRSTGDAFFARVTRETLDYLVREMRHEAGGFFSATDADSEGVEGKFFVWTKAEFAEVVGEEDAAFLADLFDVTDAGNWEGHNVLWIKEPLATVTLGHNLSEESALVRITEAKERLRLARAQRVKPLLDDKILAAWNGLAISAFAVAGSILDEPRYLAAARSAAIFIRDRMRREDGRLVRSFRAPGVAGFLEDHAFVAEGLLDLFEATGEGEWLTLGLEITERAIADFKSEDGPFYNTGPAHEVLVARLREGADGATASPNAVFARVLARLWKHTGNSGFREAAQAAIVPFGAAIARTPRAFVTALDVVSRLTSSAPEVALVGSAQHENYRELERALSSSSRRLSAVLRAHDDSTSAHPLAKDRTNTPGRSLAYVCRNFACEAPVATAEALTRLLNEPLGVIADAAYVGRKKLAGRATRAGTAQSKLAERELAGLRVSAIAVTLGSFLLEDACAVIERAVAQRVNLFLAETSRAEALGEGIRRVVAAGTPRSSLVVVALLQGASADSLTAFESKAGLLVDLALLPAEAHTIDLCFAAREGVASSAERPRFGLYLRAPLSQSNTANVLLASSLKELACLAAPYNPLDGDDQSPALVSQAGTPFVALKSLEWDRMPHTANLLDQTEPREDSPAFDSALDKLRTIERRYQKTIAPHLSTAGAVDPSDLLRFSEDLKKAEHVLDDLAEVEAFIHQSVAGAVGSAFGALDLDGAIITGPSGDPIDLGREMQTLREDYLEALDETLRALANVILIRQAKFARAAAAQLVVSVEDVPRKLCELVVSTQGISTTFVTVRKPAEVGVVWRGSPEPQSDE